MKQQKKISRSQAKKLLPVVKQFNKIADLFIRSLQKKQKIEEEKIHNLKILLNEDRIPRSVKASHSISITTVDIGETIVRTEKGKKRKRMKWEKDIRKKPGSSITGLY